jgi:asparagine synthase (glutamine-hydrolysing)
MCGIWAVLGKLHRGLITPEAALAALHARGPEYASQATVADVTLGFTRLAINGLTPAGHQPFSHSGITIVCNGEIYNYKKLAEQFKITLEDGTSDCAVLPHLYKILSPTEFCRALDGVFAFVLVDAENDRVMVARDPYGVRPLFSAAADDTTFFASEIKALPRALQPQAFPPGHYAIYKASSGELLEIQQYHSIPSVSLPLFSYPHHRCEAKAALREALYAAVHKRLMSDRPIGALLSGGLDSSLIAAIASKELRRQGRRLTTFSIGMPGSTDLVFAEKVAKHIDSDHHTILLRPQDFLGAIPEVVRAIESYDITTVRASVGNYLVGKYIRNNTDIKVVFNGDGSDEIGGGYLYFYEAPNDYAFEAESERLLKEIHLYDVLRSDRGMAAHGLEARTPFLDKAVVATWRSLATGFRRPRKPTPEGRGAAMEKQILREAFELEHLLPMDVLWRKKEAFSDGVSSVEDSWYKRCGEYAKSIGIDMTTVEKFTHNPPKTEEALLYRTLFEEAYGPEAATLIPAMWLPRWIAGATDPSARTLTTLY